MAVQVRVTTVPEGCKGWNTACDWDQKGGLAEVPYGQRPWVAGELWQIRGWLEGLGGAAITGWLEFVLHEGLTDATGDVTIYDKRTQFNIELILGKMNRIIHGIAAQFPKTNFRLKVTYKTEWSP